MKTNNENSSKSKSVKCRMVEIYESIEQIRSHLSEIEHADEINSIRYLIGSEMNVVNIYLKRIESHLKNLSDLFA
jgi:hypothetical protein